MEFEWREIFLLSLCESSNIFHQLSVRTVSVCDPSSMLHNAEVQILWCLLTISMQSLFPLKFGCKIRARKHVLYLPPQHRRVKELEEKLGNYIAPNTYSCFWGFVSSFWEIA